MRQDEQQARRAPQDNPFEVPACSIFQPGSGHGAHPEFELGPLEQFQSIFPQPGGDGKRLLLKKL